MTIEIDEGSGFCHGVTRAINKAEEELHRGEPLYCLGDIVHNGKECRRLEQMGLHTIGHDEFDRLHDAQVLLRAHGEPPSTYLLAGPGACRTNCGQRHRHRKHRRRLPSGFLTRHLTLQPDHQTAGTVPTNRRLYQGAHRPKGHIHLCRHSLPPGSQPHAAHPAVCRTPRCRLVCFRT